MTRSHLSVDLPEGHEFPRITLARVTALARMELKRARAAGVEPDVLTIVTQGPRPTDGRFRSCIAITAYENAMVATALSVLNVVAIEDRRLDVARAALSSIVEERYGA